MEKQSRIESGYVLFKEKCFHGSPTKFVRQVENLVYQLRKMEDDFFWRELEVEVVSFVIQHTMEELTR